MKHERIVVFAVLVGLLIGCAQTPPIHDGSGSSQGSAIAVREMVVVNGREQGVVIRGADRSKPVLLWLAGGPGGSELGWTTSHLGALEQDVVFVNWDQPGVGMSYDAADWETVTVDDFVEDTIAMSEYLRGRFDRDRIILVGHSWGSIIGLMAAHRRPDLYSSYVGVGQQVNAFENDLYGYRMVMDAAGRRGDTRVVRRLEEMGPPPYSRENGQNYLFLFQKVHVYSPHTARQPSVTSMLFPREYTLRNSINAVRGLLKGVSNVYPQLAELDFESSVPELEIPVYFFTGRYDETCVQDIAWRYFESLEAPRKNFVWFEGSGHNVPYHEPERFIREMQDVITQSQVKAGDV